MLQGDGEEVDGIGREGQFGMCWAVNRLAPVRLDIRSQLRSVPDYIGYENEAVWSEKTPALKHEQAADDAGRDCGLRDTARRSLPY